MRKELETISRTNKLLSVIQNSANELGRIKAKCKHQVVVEISYHNLKYGYSRNEYCLFCGEKLVEHCRYKYKFSFINVDEKYIPTRDKEYELVQKLFIETANSYPDMPLNQICEIINNIIKSKTGDGYTMIRL